MTHTDIHYDTHTHIHYDTYTHTQTHTMAHTHYTNTHNNLTFKGFNKINN